MTITIETTDMDMERQIAEAAAIRNVSVEDYTLEALRAYLPASTSPPISVSERQRRAAAGFGMFAGSGLSSERFMAEKAEEKEREERSFKSTQSQEARERRKQAALARFRNGEYADLATSSDDFAARKAEEIELEERRWRTS